MSLLVLCSLRSGSDLFFIAGVGSSALRLKNNTNLVRETKADKVREDFKYLCQE